MKPQFIPLLLISSLSILLACQENFDERLRREAQEYSSKHCPQRIEENNILDSVAYDISTRTLYRWNSLSGELDTPQTAAIMRQNSKELKDQLILELKNAPEWKECKEHDIKFGYIYLSASRKDTLYKTIITPEDYR